MYKLSFYVPESHLDTVKEAIFNAGGGRIGSYEKCAWQTQGTGQFMPSEQSKPFIGSANNIETVDEYLVEVAIADKVIKTVLDAFIDAHPYETPAYNVCPFLTADDFKND